MSQPQREECLEPKIPNRGTSPGEWDRAQQPRGRTPAREDHFNRSKQRKEALHLLQPGSPSPLRQVGAEKGPWLGRHPACAPQGYPRARETPRPTPHANGRRGALLAHHHSSPAGGTPGAAPSRLWGLPPLTYPERLFLHKTSPLGPTRLSEVLPPSEQCPAQRPGLQRGTPILSGPCAPGAGPLPSPTLPVQPGSAQLGKVRGRAGPTATFPPPGAVPTSP